MNDRVFLQMQAVQLRELLSEAGDDPILVPQLKQRLKNVEHELLIGADAAGEGKSEGAESTV